MRIYKYKAHIIPEDSENTGDYTKKGLVVVENDSLTKKEIIAKVKKTLFKKADVFKLKVKQITVIK